MTWTIKNSEDLYKIKGWGNSYFKVNDKGHLAVGPNPEDENVLIDIVDIIEELKSENVSFPVVLRFHDILRAQVRKLNNVFNHHIETSGYKGSFKGVYPIKVNQMREVVEEIVDAGEEFNYGLEAGSKAELMAVLAYNQNKDGLTILNGYKDEDYLRLALLGRRLQRKVIIVIEKFSEIKKVIDIFKNTGVMPLLGVRSKMTVKGRGKWESSSGERAKFGLSISEIVKAVYYLKDNDMLHCLKLLHFHIGSQITDIQAIKEAISEGSRLFCELSKMGASLEYFDVGGGLGVDYDGTASMNDSSINYKLDEYVADVVYGIMQACDQEGIEHPSIVTESGRALTAHHSCVITNIIGEIDNTKNILDEVENTKSDHFIIKNIKELEKELKVDSNLQEAYNDVVKYKSDAFDGFKLGLFNLEELALVESIYWRVLKNIKSYLEQKEVFSDLYYELGEHLSSQYLSNMSVFQSAADSWAIDQILPIVPIQRLNEEPLVKCSLVDITCDSDGKIDKFINEDGDIEKNLKLHHLNGEDYFIGVFLTGAYQDVMGDMHNLFGRLNEAHIYHHPDEPGNFYIEEIIKGSRAEDVLSTMQYNPQYMAFLVKKSIDKEISEKNIAPREGVKLVDFYEDCLREYTYLK